MPRWSNWSGKLSARPEGLYFVRSNDDAAAVIADANARGRTLRFAGSGHSHAALIPTGGDILDTSGLAGIVDVDAGKKQATIRGGSKLFTLGEPLRQAGLALHNQGDIDRQALAGVVSTGTHGTGRTLKNLSAGVLGFKLITASGDTLRCSESENNDIWQAGRLSLGAFGLMAEITLSLRQAYKLKEAAWEEDLESLLERTGELAQSNRHFEFFWSPASGKAFAKTINETGEPPHYPLGDEGERLAWSYEVLPSHRPIPHTEMEYSLPEEEGIPCLKALAAMIARDFPELKWPIEFRTLAADDVWLSSAYQRQTVTLSVHLGLDEDDEPLFKACERIFRDHGGRPHWGKVHYLGGKALAEIHPRWEDWWAIRDRLDPKGTFLNDHLSRIRP